MRRLRSAVRTDVPKSTSDVAGPLLTAAQTVRRRFLIVTPVYNATTFIDEAIASVLRQGLPGYALHYHVQDGGSTDGTVDKLRAWEHRLQEGLYVPHADNIVFSFASEQDGGMYDALQRGFAQLAPCDTDILTWINSDDGLAQGALVTVAGVFKNIPGCEFLSGRTALLNEAGAVIVLAPAIPFARGALADGLHDGRTLPFLMQEGTFFSGRVWNTIGGVDAAFRLAGDWDLWRRMARVVGHYVVDSVTGYHRRRVGQLSGDMDAYYREIDAAPNLEDASLLGLLGAVVTFDQASTKWIETAYDPAVVMAPALLRDGRPERSALCRPVTGFAAPEGPYPQYQLPGGIRWIEGQHAEIVLHVPTTGRYRLRLTLRANHEGLVVGLGIGSRVSQPITLEPPVPLVDQVIETVRWLDRGENRLFIDCNGPPDARSVLMIRCEVTTTDEHFRRRPVVAPVQPGHPASQALAIVILCEDEEPDLLDVSLANCTTFANAEAATVSVFVVRNPQNAAIDRVLRAHHLAIAGYIDSDDLETALEPLRQGLHAKGHDDVLIVRRGSLLTPRGINAAIALLDATGNGIIDGLVDERDSTGRVLQLSYTPGTAPMLCRAKNGAISTGPTSSKLGCALTQTLAHSQNVYDTTPLWVLDDESPMLGRTPAALLTAGLALLGYDVRHVVVGAGRLPTLPPAAVVIATPTLAARSGATLTIACDGEQLRFAQRGGWTIRLPLAVDTELFLPRDRQIARLRLGFAPDDRIVCIAEVSPNATATVVAQVTAMERGDVQILNFGADAPGLPLGGRVHALGTLADPVLLSYLLSASDAAVASGVGTLLAGAAWACGLTVIDSDGMVLHPGASLLSRAHGHDAADGYRTRDLIVATRSLAALATAIDAECPDFGGVGGSTPLRLRGGTVRVRSYRDPDERGWFDPIAGSGTLVWLNGGVASITTHGECSLPVMEADAELTVCFPHADITGLRLHVRGMPGEVWTVRCGLGMAGREHSATVRIGEYGVATATLVGAFEPGPTRIRFEPHADDRSAATLHVVGVSATGDSAATTPGWEETAFALVPAAGWPTSRPMIDGDWQRGPEFLPAEPAVPQEGLFTRFRWSSGNRCTVRLRVDVGGARRLRLALAAGVAQQRIRPVLNGKVYDWCLPLDGPIGHIERREWLVDWPTGDVDVTLELSDVLRPPGQELGIILFEVTLGSAE